MARITDAADELTAIVEAAHEAALELVSVEVRYERGTIDADERQRAYEAALAEFYVDDKDNLRSGLLQVALVQLAAWAVRRQPS